MGADGIELEAVHCFQSTSTASACIRDIELSSTTATTSTVPIGARGGSLVPEEQLDSVTTDGILTHRTCLHVAAGWCARRPQVKIVGHSNEQDRKSTRLNSSHMSISYAVFCLKKKNVTRI